jgi:proteasome lid subunit RPN8/RPN11
MHYELMLNDVIKRAPIEACGMVAGLDNQSVEIYTITNILNSPVRFRMAPEEQLNTFIKIDSMGLELIGIYHSHPNGPARPSSTDISEYYYPGTISLIWSQNKKNWVCHGYIIDAGKAREVPIFILRIE